MYVCGREPQPTGEPALPTGRLGRYLARDGSTAGPVGIDLDRPHVVLVVGKRGAGKSYTLGVLAEALTRTDGVVPVLVDPMGTFQPLAESTLPVRERAPTLRADALSPRDWCHLVSLSPQSPAGALVWRAATSADTLPAMRRVVVDAEATRAARRAATNHLDLAAAWDVFAESVPPVAGEAAGSVVGVDRLDRAPMTAVVAGIASRLYERRLADATKRLPWLLLDEAHALTDGVAADALERIVTRGRQPGVSLVAATQRPAALPSPAVSQADLVIVHRLTDRRDRDALTALSPSYLEGTLADRMPTTPGQALVIDDTAESVHTIVVRERETPHGGTSPRVSARRGKSKPT